jgi:hypothetical protein
MMEYIFSKKRFSEPRIVDPPTQIAVPGTITQKPSSPGEHVWVYTKNSSEE